MRGCRPGLCHQSNQNFNLPSDPIQFRSDFVYNNKNEYSQLSPVFWQAFVNKSVEWMSKYEKAKNLGNAEKGRSVSLHQLIVSTWNLLVPTKDAISQRQASDINRCIFPQLSQESSSKGTAAVVTSLQKKTWAPLSFKTLYHIMSSRV